jgi:DNA modification methylase
LSVAEVLSGARPWAVVQGDALDVLRGMPDGCVQCCVTSPPYFSLRSYLPAGHADKALELGGEQSPDCLGWATGSRCGCCFVCRMTAVFEEVRRVLRPDGTLWLNVAGGYSGGGGFSPTAPSNLAGSKQTTQHSREYKGRNPAPGWKQKDFINTPALLAESLRAAGWFLRAEVALTKLSPMPESCRDRPTRATEKLYLLAKGPRYYYDAEAERVAATRPGDVQTFGARHAPASITPDDPRFRNGSEQWGRAAECPAGRNLWDYWGDDEPDLPEPSWPWHPEPSRAKHYAAFPTWLPRRCLRLGASLRGCCPACGAPWRRAVERKGGTTGRGWNDHEHDADRGRRFEGSLGTSTASSRAWESGEYQRRTTGWHPSCPCPPAEPIGCLTLDPFAGTGTVGLVARRLGMRFVGIDLNGDYCGIARRRVADASPLADLADSPAPSPQPTLFDTEGPQ